MNEGQIQNAVRVWLDAHGLFYVNPHFGKRSTIRPDWPDFTIFAGSRFLLIESKTTKGPLSEGQKELHVQLRKAGIRVEVCRSVEEHVKTVSEWLETVPAVEWRTVLNPPAAGHVGTPAGVFAGMLAARTDREMVEEPTNRFLGMDIHVSKAMPKDAALMVDPVAGRVLGAIVNIADRPDASGERIGEYAGKRWLIRADAKGNESMIRLATDADIARVTVNRAKA